MRLSRSWSGRKAREPVIVTTAANRRAPSGTPLDSRSSRDDDRASIASEGLQGLTTSTGVDQPWLPPGRSDVDHELDAQCSADAKQSGKHWVVLTALEPRDGPLTHPQQPRERGPAETMLGAVAEHHHSHGTSERRSLPLPAVLGTGVQMPCEHVLVGRQIGKLHVERDTKPANGRAEWSYGGTL
jgi:hypothetical protein